MIYKPCVTGLLHPTTDQSVQFVHSHSESLNLVHFHESAEVCSSVCEPLRGRVGNCPLHVSRALRLGGSSADVLPAEHSQQHGSRQVHGRQVVAPGLGHGGLSLDDS